MRTSALVLLLSLTITLSSAHDYCKPTQIHLALSDAFTPDPSSASPIKAIFHTEEVCDTAYITLDTLDRLVTVHATAVNYFSANYSGTQYETYVHIFDFPQLDYGQVYQYTCYPDTTGQNPSQGPFSFYVPNPNPDNEPVSVVMYGDLGATNDGQDTLDFLSSVKADNFSKVAAYIHMGDISYDLEDNGGQTGDDFMDAVQDFAASIPYMISPGNHETLANFSNVNMRFKMPYFAQTQNHYYSYNLGNMHFVTINLDLVILNPELLSVMVDWLDNDLAQANQDRDERPWIIIYTHRPLYCSKDTDDCKSNAITYSQIEDVINKYGVDLYMSGHIHAYERMLPIYRGKVAQYEHVAGDKNYNYIVNPQAPVYVVQGMAGHSGDHDGKKPYAGKNFTVTVDTEYSVVGLHSLNNTHLYLENIHSKSGEVTDFFYIIKDSKEDNHWSLFEKWESIRAYMKEFK